MSDIIDWLMEGDAAIRWQTQRDLLESPAVDWQSERLRVASSGWGARLLAYQDSRGTWGGGIYSPKWTSTTYTLLQLRDMGLPGDHPAARRASGLLLDEGLGEIGTRQFQDRLSHGDLCIVGMYLGLSVYFGVIDARTDALVDHLIQHQMPDGGWNCRSLKQPGVHHSSFHTTFNVLEGLREVLDAGLTLHSSAILAAQAQALEFMLQHSLFRSHRTGEIITEKFLYFSYPYRWYYDVLRGLDYFQRARAIRDQRLSEATEILNAKQRKDGAWAVQNYHPGQAFFELEKTGGPSRWNTLRALRVLSWWNG